jgi:hypothetical protein
MPAIITPDKQGGHRLSFFARLLTAFDEHPEVRSDQSLAINTALILLMFSASRRIFATGLATLSNGPGIGESTRFVFALRGLLSQFIVAVGVTWAEGEG